MFTAMKKQEKILTDDVELICGTCNLPVAGQKARSEVTRYLSDLSRCQCHLKLNAENSEGTAQPSSPPELEKSSKGAQKMSTSLSDASEILGERFEVLSFLGQGGMGTVFKVKEKNLDKIFAVKILDPRMVKDALSVKRFEQEAKAAIQLTHPNLAAVYEYGIGVQGTPYLVMDYLEGKTLAEILESENYIDHGRVVDLFIQICEGIMHAHLKGVIHRDIKPSNIMISKSASGIEYAKVFDFGIAKVMPERAIDFTQELTQTGELFGSPAYMSPEQLKGLPVDERTDIYSLGCALYKALTGKLPFEGKSVVDTIVKVVTTEAEDFADLKSKYHIPIALEDITLCCLAKEPSKRYADVGSLMHDLESVRESKPISNTAKSFSKKDYEAKQKGKRKKLITIVGLTVVLTGAILASMWQTPVSHQQFRNKDFEDAWNYDMQAASRYGSQDYDMAIPLMQFGIEAYKKGFKTGQGTDTERAYMADLYQHIGKCFLKKGQMAQTAGNNGEAEADFLNAQKNYREAIPLYNKVASWYPRSYFSECITDYVAILNALGQSDKANSLEKEYRQNNTVKEIP
ncbi:MAG: serine/threonine protein kinase, partial [Candidatus Obscuribacterales bacterium]|nr:serine/threonine protein kinase [Candidatus Obscuribacterales bacterium]